ncbi:MAG: monovalent cation/H+ antiporter complex subunit F [Gammaproteobacteria bacterium]
MSTFMAGVITLSALLLAVALLAGLIRVWRGPCDTDRMLAMQLLGTSGIALLLLLGYQTRGAGLVDTALVLALLAAAAVVAFTRQSTLALHARSITRQSDGARDRDH